MLRHALIHHNIPVGMDINTIMVITGGGVHPFPRRRDVGNVQGDYPAAASVPIHEINAIIVAIRLERGQSNVSTGENFKTNPVATASIVITDIG